MDKRDPATRQAILSAARALALESGWESVSVRKVAASIGYKAPILYQFFENRDDLLAQVIVDGFIELRGNLARTWKKSGPSSLLPIAMEYWKFARKNPDVYEALNLTSPKQQNPDVAFQAAQICEQIATCLTAWARHHDYTVDAVETTDLLWAHMHGLVTLGLGQALGDGKRVESLIALSVSLLEKALARP